MLHEIISINGKRPYKRHRAIISKCGVPYKGKVLSGEVAVTSCGLAIRRFQEVDGVSEFYTDNTRFTENCQKCFEE